MFKKKWKHTITAADGNCVLFGVDIFDYDWVDTKEEVRVVDPIYRQTHNFRVYSVEINGKYKRFAAGELSNCVWAFYLEK